MSHWSGRLAGFALCFSLVACGGGGSSFSVDLEPKRIDLSGDEAVVLHATLIGRVSGRPSGSIYVGTVDEGDALLDAVWDLGRDPPTLEVTTKPTLEPGVHTGTLVVLVCSDRDCEHPIAGAPFRIPYTIDLRGIIWPTPDHLALSAFAGSTARQDISIRLPPGAVDYEVRVEDFGSEWLALEEKRPDGLTVAANAMSRGDYPGFVILTVPGYTPRDIPVLFHAAPRRVAVTPKTVELSAVSGETASAWIDVALPDDATEFTAQPFADSPTWVGVSDVSAAGFRVIAPSLPHGSYSGWACVDAGDSRDCVQVNYTVSPGPGEHGILVAPDTIALGATEGGRSEVRTFSVTPPTWDTELHARVEYGPAPGAPSPPGPAWLIVTPLDGGFAVQADASDLAQGSRSAWVTIEGNAFTAPQSVRVTLTTGPGLVPPAEATFTATGTTVPSDLRGSRTISMVSGPARPWSARSDSTWLSLDASSGSTGQALRFHVDTGILAQMENGATARATVTVEASPATITPTTFHVSLTKWLPEIRWVTPRVRLAGRPNRVLVRGIGFDGLGGDVSAVSVDGLEDARITHRTDGELQLDLPAAPAGPYTVRASNALGLPTASGALEMLEPVDLPYAKLGWSGARSGLVYDPAAKVLYSANAHDGLVDRFALEGGEWTASFAGFAGLKNLAFTPDGSSLIVATCPPNISSTCSLSLVAPDTLTVRNAWVKASGFELDGHAPALAVTNDGRVFTPVWPQELDYFDLWTRSYARIPRAEPWWDLYRAPAMFVSRDGERMIFTQGTRGDEPAMYLDAREGVPRIVPPPLTSQFTVASQSEDASRVIIGIFQPAVFDAAYAKVGDVVVPGATIHGAVMAPGGDRAYVLGYPWPTPTRPEIFVVAADQALPDGTLQVLGTFEFPDFPTCVDGTSCEQTALMEIAPDGRTIFLAGDQGVIVVPVPQALRPR